MFFKKIFTYPILGRWGARNKQQKNIIQALSNMDHCGEHKCKCPKEYKKMIDEIVKEKTK